MYICVFLQYMSNVDSWCKACGEVDLPSELQDLEDAIHHHQGLYEHITAAYSEVQTVRLEITKLPGTLEKSFKGTDPKVNGTSTL